MLSLVTLQEMACRVGLLAAATAAAPLDKIKARLRELQQQGIVVPWAPPAVELRCNPAAVLPGARSVIAVALPYLVDPYAAHTAPAKDEGSSGSRGDFQSGTGASSFLRDPTSDFLPPASVPDLLPPTSVFRVDEELLSYRPPPTFAGRGRISRCSWGRDYHVVLRAKLERLIALLRTAAPPQASFYFQVDNGPLVERAFAAAAGLGFIGKNCSLIVPPYGSWVFLGLIVTDLEIENGTPLSPACGRCTRCLEACPTGALEAPYLVNPARCLSYVTQAGGDIPEELRPLLGDRLYGCDTCQEVCPYNARAVYSREPDFQPVRDDYAPLLVEIITMPRPDFQNRWGQSTLGWRGANIFTRNAAVALGNAGDKSSLPFLQQAVATHLSPIVRRHAAWAVEKLGSGA